ncbi:MAG: 6,7-dimethyl-8-ribityllumazine synthase [Planctomycetes bacterium]|nr:6,7-dimethyl-8-ribityllumazine synthase [Planctomycetota bacterium]
MKKLQGKLDAQGKKFAIVASRFNDFVVAALIRGAEDVLVRLGADADAISLCRVPGALEIPAVAARMARSGSCDAVICLGAVIRGATPHFDYVAAESAKGISQLALEGKIPVINGIITTDSIEQAVERAGTKAGNKGADAALAAVEMVSLYAAIREQHG